jgi:hypothetical protein
VGAELVGDGGESRRLTGRLIPGVKSLRSSRERTSLKGPSRSARPRGPWSIIPVDWARCRGSAIQEAALDAQAAQAAAVIAKKLAESS